MKNPETMTLDELKKWLSARLQMQGSSAADINIRLDESPYELPAQLWKSGDEVFRDNFKRVVYDLVVEAGSIPWAPSHFNELGLLIEVSNLWEVVKPLEGIAQSRCLLQHQHGQQVHMLALRTLLSLGWKGTPDFWRAQEPLVGRRWPGIIFEGLAVHDLQMAFDRLPVLVTDRETMIDVLNLFPGLMRDLRVGISELRDKCRNLEKDVHPEAASELREWFRMRNYPLFDIVTYTNRTLKAALSVLLGSESEPKTLSPMLTAKVA